MKLADRQDQRNQIDVANPSNGDLMESFWDTVVQLSSTREANVETWLVLPLLEALGHDRSCIDSKVSVNFQEGRKSSVGRKPEADFVVYAETTFSRSTSLVVIETKRPDEQLCGGRQQGESYAQNLRAPILMMTNGRRLEIWQSHITTESRLVLECDVSDLKCRRADIESLISKKAIHEHCSNIEYKCFDIMARDFSNYERSEHSRASPVVRRAIPRVLKAAGTSISIDSQDLLSSFPRGAVIFGGSGFGKTTLAATLLYEGIERRWLAESDSLPIDVFLPYTVLNGDGFENFLVDRIVAHKPSFTLAQLQKIAREQGLLIIADGFERIPANKRDLVEGMLSTFLRDYSKSQVIILTRSMPLEIDLPVLELVGYTTEDLYALGRNRTGDRSDMPNPFVGAPEYVYKIAEVPLLADRMLDRYSLELKHTTSIVSLYETWLDQIFRSSKLIDRANEQSVLEKIALETVLGPISVDRAINLCCDRADSKMVLERLADASAISVRGTTLELHHESLADYLRAIQYWKVSPTDDLRWLDALTFDPSSQFCIFLVATAPTDAARGSAWQAIARANMQLAIHSLRFAAGNEVFDQSNKDIDTLRFLSDIRQTIEIIISSHLKPIAASLYEEIAGEPVNKLGISGIASADDVSYSFYEAKGTPTLVRLESPDKWEQRHVVYGHALRRVGYGADAGRILGIERIQDALSGQVKKRSLSGGPIWIEEQVLGRLRHLAKQYEFPVNIKNLQSTLAILEPYRDKYVSASGFRAGQTFAMEYLINDIEWLIEHNTNEIELWSDGFSALNLKDQEGRQQFGNVINQYYKRLQMAYSEVAEASFPAVRSYLPILRTMPFRFEVEAECHTRRGYEDVTLHYRRWPVATFDEAGADVTFPLKLSDYNSNKSVQQYVDRTDALLSRFGRFFPSRSIQWGGTRLPDFEGHDPTFGGLPDESVVVREAMRWLRDDLKTLFSETPSVSLQGLRE